MIQKFKVIGTPIEYRPYGEGHINDTFYLKTEEEGDYHTYIIQKINNHVFNDVNLLMNNVVNVTTYLRKRIVERGGNPDRETLTVIPTVDGKAFLEDESGFYRMYLFISNATAHQMVLNDEMFYNQGVAVGNFQGLLEGFNIDLIEDTIPHFHDTKRRFQHFCEAVEKDEFDRAKTCQTEIDFVNQHESIVGEVIDALENQEIPIRVTHNDTKLNNVLIDDETNEGICMIDLDTMMKGSLVYDFGDAIRFGATSAKEDEADLTKVNFNFNLFKVFTDGFLQGIGNSITSPEIELLPMGVIMITLEQGLRFLTDYLAGDVYYKINYEDHNLVRARNQLKLLSEMNEKLDEMNAYVKQFIKK